MKKYRFLKDFLGMSKNNVICEFENNDIIKALLNDNIIEEVKPKPKNRFLLKAEDIDTATIYWYITPQNIKSYTGWEGYDYEIARLANHNVFLSEAECDAEIARNEAVNKYLKCVARHNEARGFEPKFDNSKENYLFKITYGKIHIYPWAFTQLFPLRYYFHKDDAESIRKELGDECLMLVFGDIK